MVQLQKNLRRSTGFWLGLFILCFLVWLWVNSFFLRTTLSLPHPYPIFTIESGTILTEWDTGPGARIVANSHIVFRSRRIRWNPTSDMWFPDFYQWSDGEVHYSTSGGISISARFPKRVHEVRVALWMLVVSYVLIWWIGMMCWRSRQRRMQKKLNHLQK